MIAVRDEQVSQIGAATPCQDAPPIAAQQGRDGATGAGPAPSVRVVDPNKKAWIGLELTDRKKRPVPHAPYEVVLPDGGTIKGNLDANGKTRIEGIDPGECTVTFPTLDRREFV